MIKTKY